MVWFGQILLYLNFYHPVYMILGFDITVTISGALVSKIFVITRYNRHKPSQPEFIGNIIKILMEMPANSSLKFDM